jgi:hypothetical protein
MKFRVKVCRIETETNDTLKLDFEKKTISQTQIYDWFLKSSAEDTEYSSL